MLLVFLFLGIFLVRLESRAAERPLRISYPPASVFLPLWVANDAGLFKRNGVAVELVYVGSSPTALAAVLADQMDVAGGAGFIGVASYAQGFKDLAFFANLTHRMTYSIYAHPSITDINGLRGKRFGVSRFGGIGDFVGRYFLKRVGLDARKDLSLIQLGSPANIVMGLTRGAVDSAAVPVPHTFTMKKLGFSELADLTAQSDARYAGAAFLAKRSFILNNKSRMEAVAKSLIEGVHYVRTHRRESLEILARYTRVTDMETLGMALDYDVKHVLSKIPDIQPEDLNLILEQVQETIPKARDVNPSDLVYGQLMSDMVKNGFVDKLYK